MRSEKRNGLREGRSAVGSNRPGLMSKISLSTYLPKRKEMTTTLISTLKSRRRLSNNISAKQETIDAKGRPPNQIQLITTKCFPRLSFLFN